MLQGTRNEHAYNDLITTAIDMVKDRGFKEIRADIGEYEPPHQLIGKTNNVNFTPDVTASKNDAKAYFEIGMKDDNVNDLVNKWKLLETLAQMKNGSFSVLVPRGHMKFTKDLLREHSINADVIKL